MKKTIIIIVSILLCLAVGGVAALIFRTPTQTASVSGGFNKYNSVVLEFSEQAVFQQSEIDEQQSAIEAVRSDILAMQTSNRSFMAEKNVRYELFDKPIGTIKIIAVHSGDNYIDFYNSNGSKVSSLTFNMSKNDVLYVSYWNDGLKATLMKFHDGDNASTKDYSSTTESLTYFTLANNEAFVSLS